MMRAPSQHHKIEQNLNSKCYLEEMMACDLTSYTTNESGPDIGLSAYSSLSSKIQSEGKASVARSINSFKSYKTDDSNASCLFVTQL